MYKEIITFKAFLRYIYIYIYIVVLDRYNTYFVISVVAVKHFVFYAVFLIKISQEVNISWGKTVVSGILPDLHTYLGMG